MEFFFKKTEIIHLYYAYEENHSKFSFATSDFFFFVREGIPDMNLRGYFNNRQCPGCPDIACNP